MRVLRPLLEDDDNRVRANAARLMILLGDRNASKVLEAMLAHRDRWWRASACHALGECRPPGAAALLARALRDPELDVRLNATKALRDLEDPMVPQLLLSLLSDKNLYIRLHAVEALGNLRVRSAASPLRAALRQEAASQVIAAALVAVARTSTPEAAGREIAPYLAHASPAVRLAAVEALAPVVVLGEAVAALRGALKDSDRRVRAATVRAFFDCGQLKVVSSLYESLLADDRDEQIAVAHALGELSEVVFGMGGQPRDERLVEALRKLPAYGTAGTGAA
jgi:HEAT repeat protein